MLADEITSELRAIRDAALEAAASQQEVVSSSLESKGVHYGHISAHPDGTVDASEVEGVDADLRIRPFFAQGGTISMREFIVGAFKAEMGLEVFDPVLCAVTDQNQLVVSMAGMMFDPALDTFERPPVCSRDEDGDSDGVGHEVNAALIDYM
jgi:hypothetical protein